MDRNQGRCMTAEEKLRIVEKEIVYRLNTYIGSACLLVLSGTFPDSSCHFLSPPLALFPFHLGIWESF